MSKIDYSDELITLRVTVVISTFTQEVTISLNRLKCPSFRKIRPEKCLIY